MPRYLVRIRAKDKQTGRRKTIYGVYSTIVSDWLTGFFPSLRDIRKLYPFLKNVKPVPYKEIFGKEAEAIIEGKEVVLKYPVYVLGSPGSGKSRRRKRKKRRKGK
ncbi:MAG: hypothetical protein DRJ36_02790 [Thermoprotei archaeon]|nr:MAG: hypothetical protein DRJ36_02790 [Thermoprotei archaeon]